MDPLEYVSSYVEALVSLLVFGISIPTFLMNVQSRLRQIREQYGNEIDLGPVQLKVSRLFGINRVVIIVIISILLILIYQVPTFRTFCDSFVPQPHGVGCAAWQGFIDLAPYWVNALLLFNIVITALFIWILGSYRRDSIIHRLGHECRKQAKRNQGRLEDDLLLNLGELGELCIAGREKQGVLQTIDDLLTLDLTPKSWSNMAEAVIRTTTGGDERNVAQSIKLLQSIFRRSNQSTIGEAAMKQFHNQKILAKLEDLYIQSFGMDSAIVDAQMMTGYDELADQAPNDAAKAFLRIGRVALQRDLYGHAVAALDKLDTLLTERIDEQTGICPPQHLDALHNYFALIAYFWNHGISTRLHAMRYLEQLCDGYGWDNEHLNQLFSEASQTMKASNLRTADMLEQMLFSNRQMTLVQRVLAEVEGVNERHAERILMRFPSLAELRGADFAALMSCGVQKNQAEVILRQVESF